MSWAVDLYVHGFSWRRFLRFGLLLRSSLGAASKNRHPFVCPATQLPRAGLRRRVGQQRSGVAQAPGARQKPLGVTARAGGRTRVSSYDYAAQQRPWPHGGRGGGTGRARGTQAGRQAGTRAHRRARGCRMLRQQVVLAVGMVWRAHPAGASLARSAALLLAWRPRLGCGYCTSTSGCGQRMVCVTRPRRQDVIESSCRTSTRSCTWYGMWPAVVDTRTGERAAVSRLGSDDLWPAPSLLPWPTDCSQVLSPPCCV